MTGTGVETTEIQALSASSTAETEDTDIHFEPAVDLPEVVETRTGEEEETVLYSHREKFYTFSSGEWKERGPGCF